MGPRWSGAAGVLAEAVAELVGAGRWWGRRRAKGRTSEPVVVELRGGAESDADRLLKRLAEYDTKLPVNTPETFVRADDGSAPFADLLKDVVRWYGYPGLCRRRRPIRFRRFRMMQVAYEAWGRAEEPEGAADTVRKLEQDCERAAYNERGGLLNELNRLRGQAVRDEANTAALAYGTGAVLAALTLVPLAEWVIRHVWVHRPARRWFERKLGVSTAKAMYKKLWLLHEEDADVRNQWLVEAFLADIDAYYHLGRRLNHSRLPLLLILDAAPGTQGGELLRHLRREDQPGHRVPRRSSPVVVAHAREGTGEPIVITDDVFEAALKRGGSPLEFPELPPDDGDGTQLALSGAGPVAATLSASVALGLVAVVGVAWPIIVPGVRCGQGLTLWPDLVERGGQCTGVTDGGSGGEFRPELAAVSRQIEKENEAVERSGEVYATVALMLPMTPEDRPGTRQTLNEVKGAYLAQYEANHSAQLGERKPRIRLVLANPGREYEHWKGVTDQLIDMANDPGQRLRAVTGFNLSVKNTEHALAALTAAGVPVVGGPVTADEMENERDEDGRERYPGMARIVPTNSEQAAALVNHNRRTPQADSVLVVDTRPDDEYNESLADAFRKAVPSSTKDREFTSPGPHVEGDVANDFARLTGLICNQGARNIYFAGRPLHLRSFLHQLAVNPCDKTNYKVITGSGASTVALQLSDDDWKELAQTDAQGNRKITVQYAAAGHPDAWEKSGLTGPARDFYKDAGAEMRRLKELGEDLAEGMGGGVDWADSRAMTSHDSVYLAVNAIKRAYRNAVPTSRAVTKEWAFTSDQGGGVAGSTGMLCLDNTGNPYNKAVSIVTLDPTERSVRFEAPAWPKKQPSRDCTVPGTS